jgi:hypothetical protein
VVSSGLEELLKPFCRAGCPSPWSSIRGRLVDCSELWEEDRSSTCVPFIVAVSLSMSVWVWPCCTIGLPVGSCLSNCNTHFYHCSGKVAKTPFIFPESPCKKYMERKRILKFTTLSECQVQGHLRYWYWYYNNSFF